MAKVNMADIKIYPHSISDNTRWQNFESRENDIYVCTPAKCGTTWTQTIVANLIFAGEDLPMPVMQLCPWVEAVFNPEQQMFDTLSQQNHRRAVKSHSAADGLPWFGDAKYIFVGRDARDVFMSMSNHLHRMKSVEEMNALAASEDRPEMQAYDGNIHGFYEQWMNDSSQFFDIVASFWARKSQDNLLFVHYNDLKQDLGGGVKRIAQFLGIELTESQYQRVIERCSFEYMRNHPEMVGDMEVMFEGGLKGFIFKGTNGRWREVLSEEELSVYHSRARQWLPNDAIKWIENGGNDDV